MNNKSDSENSQNVLHKSRVKFLQNMTTNEKQKFLNSFDRVFCDCDGVLWKTMRETIPGSAEGIAFLRSHGKQVTFVTNNSVFAIAQQLKTFKHCNISIEEQDIIHPAQTICDYLREIQFKGLIYCIATSPFKALLKEAGFQLIEEENCLIPENIEDLRAALFDRPSYPVKAVIIDVDFNLTAVKLLRAHVYLKDPECILIGGAADTLIPFGDGEVFGPGPFINVVENSAKRKAIILGKPGQDLRDYLLRRFSVDDPRRTLFIGDSLTSDIKFGTMCGFQTLLVFSGGTKPQDLENQLTHVVLPDYATDSLGDFVQ